MFNLVTLRNCISKLGQCPIWQHCKKYDRKLENGGFGNIAKV